MNGLITGLLMGLTLFNLTACDQATQNNKDANDIRPKE